MPARSVSLDELDSAGLSVPELETPERLSAELGISLASVYRLIQRGEIPTLRIGRRQLSHPRLIVQAASAPKPGRVPTPKQREKQLRDEEVEARKLGF